MFRRDKAEFEKLRGCIFDTVINLARSIEIKTKASVFASIIEATAIRWV